MGLTSEERSRIIELRRTLHQNPELAGGEGATAGLLLDFLAGCRPDEVIPEMGGHGFAVVFNGRDRGPTVAIRAELDAVPVIEANRFAHCSKFPGVSHKCGHDGHAAMVAGLGALLAHRPSFRGRVVLLFQPSEETGEGAERFIADPRFQSITPDWVFALHNLPGHPRGQVIVRPGVFACASTGMVIRLEGATSHAAHPEQARCPAVPMAEIIKALIALPQEFDFFTLVTVIHARLGEAAFGTTPGLAEVMATLRAAGDEGMERLLARARELAEKHALSERLDVSFFYRDPFKALSNDREATNLIRTAAREKGMGLLEITEPFRWSDDFGLFTAMAKGAMFGLGAGRSHDPLHSPTYDFPDELIPAGVELFRAIIEKISGRGDAFPESFGFAQDPVAISK